MDIRDSILNLRCIFCFIPIMYEHLQKSSLEFLRAK